MKAHLHTSVFRSFNVFCLIWLTWVASFPAYGQASTDQATVSADQMLNNATRQQLQDLVNQRNSFQLEVNKTEQADDNFHNYAQQRVTALLKQKHTNGSHGLSKEKQGELYALQHWLDQNAQTRLQEQSRLQQLDQAITNFYFTRYALRHT
jgi:hypothetical protein